MSYSIHLIGEVCAKCGHQPAPPRLPDPTYNLTGIFDLALTGRDLPNPELSEFQAVVLGERTDRPRGLRLLNGKRAGETEAWMRLALSQMRDQGNREKFLALEDPDGWGTLQGAVRVMGELVDAAKECPDHVWEIC